MVNEKGEGQEQGEPSVGRGQRVRWLRVVSELGRNEEESEYRLLGKEKFKISHSSTDRKKTEQRARVRATSVEREPGQFRSVCDPCPQLDYFKAKLRYHIFYSVII